MPGLVEDAARRFAVAFGHPRRPVRQRPNPVIIPLRRAPICARTIFVQAIPLPPSVQAFAPDFAGRFGRILALLAKLVAAGFLRNPRLVLLIVPLWNRLNRTARRCERLMAHVAAGRLPKRHATACASPGAPTAAPPDPAVPRPSAPALPTRRGWLVRELGSEAACYGSQMQALLAEPAAVELLRLVPTANRIVNPILRMLGIDPFAPRQRPIRPAPAPPPAAVRPPAPTRPRAPPPPGEDAPRCSGFPWHLLLGLPEKPA